MEHRDDVEHGQRADGSRSVACRTVIAVCIAAASLLLIGSSLFVARQLEEWRMQANTCHGECTGTARTDDISCLATQCSDAVARMRLSLNHSADACVDFYEYACGGWDEKRSAALPSFNTLQQHVDHRIEVLLSRLANTTTGPFRKLGQFFESCLWNGASHANMLNMLQQLGGYASSSLSRSSLTSLVGALLKVNGAPLFDVYADTDPTQRSRLAIFVDLPQRASYFIRLLHFGPYMRQPAKPVYEHTVPLNRRTRRHAEQSEAFRYMKASAEEKRLLALERLVHVFLPAPLATAERAAEAQKILLFAAMLSKILPREKEVLSRLQSRHVLVAYNVSRLQQQFDFIEWHPLLSDLFSWNFSPNSTLYVLVPNYMERLTNMIKLFDTRVVQNALLLLYARDTLQELVNATTSRTFCAHLTTNLFSGAVSALYVRQYEPHFLQTLKTKVTELFEQLKETLAVRVRHNSWLDEPSRAAVLSKLAALRGQFFTWPQFWNDTFVTNLMNDVDVRTDDFFNNVIRRYRQLRIFNASFEDHQPYEKRWTFPFIANAFYEPILNSIVLPLAVLTQPYFRSDNPSYILYSTMGLVFTHEILHAFDLTGAQFDGLGDRGSLLSNASMSALEDRVECVARQYARCFRRQVKFLGANVDVQFDWYATRNENMADISGLHIAFETWKNLQGLDDPRLPNLDLTPEQLFFVSAAQSYCSRVSPEDYVMLVEVDFHTPFPERVNGIMMNSPEFTKAFHCPAGSAMNPVDKCRTW